MAAPIDRRQVMAVRDSRLMLAALIYAEISSPFETAMIFAALSTLFKVYHDPVHVGWLVTVFLLVQVAMAAVGARLGDLFGRRRILCILLGTAAFGSLISAMSNDLDWILFGRALQGVTSAIMPLCIGLINQHGTTAQRPVWTGYLTTAASMAAGLGLVIGGAIVDHFQWQGIFYASALLAATGLLAVLLLVPGEHARAASAEVDWLGALLFVPTVAGVMLLISSAPGWGPADARLIGLAASIVLLGGLFTVHSLRSKAPLINIRLLGERSIGLGIASLALIGLGPMQLTMLMSLLMQQPTWTIVGLGVSAALAGTLKLPANLLGSFGSVWAGHAIARSGVRPTIVIGAIILLSGWLALSFFHNSLWFVAAAAVVIIFGVQVVYATVNSSIAAAAPRDRVSEVTGLSQVARATSMALGAQTVTAILVAYTISSPRHPGIFPSSAAFQASLLLVTLVSAVILLLALLHRKPAEVARDRLSASPFPFPAGSRGR